MIRIKFTRKFVGGTLEGITMEDGFKATEREFRIWKGLEQAGHIFTGLGTSPYVISSVQMEELQ